VVHLPPGPRPSSSCPAAIRCCAAAFSASNSASPCADPRCSNSRDPRREDHTTCMHRGRVRRGLHCLHVRHQATLRAAPSAQVQLTRTANPQVSNPATPTTVKSWPNSGQVVLRAYVGITTIIGRHQSRSQRPPGQDEPAAVPRHAGAAPRDARRRDQRVPPDRVNYSLNPQVRRPHGTFGAAQGRDRSAWTIRSS
jgi:hypothetical protein